MRRRGRSEDPGRRGPRRRAGAGVSSPRRVHRLLGFVVAALVLAQALLAGRALLGPWSITEHGVVGNATFAVALAAVGAAVAARAGWRAVVVAGLLAVVLATQIALGYAGLDSAEATAWRIPTGVLAFGLDLHQLGGVGGRRR